MLAGSLADTNGLGLAPGPSIAPVHDNEVAVPSEMIAMTDAVLYPNHPDQGPYTTDGIPSG
jgi:hypothetical protein